MSIKAQENTNTNREIKLTKNNDIAKGYEFEREKITERTSTKEERPARLTTLVHQLRTLIFYTKRRDWSVQSCSMVKLVSTYVHKYTSLDGSQILRSNTKCPFKSTYLPPISINKVRVKVCVICLSLFEDQYLGETLRR